MAFLDTFQLGRYETWELDALLEIKERPAPFLLNTFFNREKVFNTRSIEFDVVEGARRLAPFVSPLVAGKPMRREGYKTMQLAPAYIKPTDLVVPSEGFVRRAGEAYGGTMSPQARFDMLVADVLDQHRQMIENRLEWMAAQALVNGGITISGDDYPTVFVDFNRDASLDIALVGAAQWPAATATPLDDIEAAALTVRRVSKGAVVTDLVMDGQAWSALRKHPEIRDLIDTNYRQGVSSVDAAPRNDLNRGISVGNLGGRFNLWVYDAYYNDETGAEQPFLPPYTVLGMSSAIEGWQYYGAIIDLDANIEPRKIFSKSERKFNPSGLEVVTQSAPLVAPRRPNAMFKLTVA